MKKLFALLLLGVFFLSFASAEYYVDIHADTVSGATGGVTVTDLGSGVFRINATNGNYEIDRALVMKWLFYGTSGSDPRATSTYITNPTKVISNDDRDKGRRGHYASVTNVNGATVGIYTGTFSDTTNNFNISSWSIVSNSVSSGSAYAHWRMPTTTALNSQINQGTSDELGTDKTLDQKNNPANCHVQAFSVASGHTSFSRAIILAKSTISWGLSGSAAIVDTDFFVDEGFPAFIYFPEVVLNSPEDDFRELEDTDIVFNATSTIDASKTLSNITLYINEVLNETKSLSGTEDTETFTRSFSIGDYNWSVITCDNESICTTSETREFTIQNFVVNLLTYNTTSFETATETFSVNVSGDPTSAVLVYNGTAYTSTKSGDIFTRTIQVTTGNIGNRPIYWRFDALENSDTFYQNVSETVFTLCNSSYTTTFLNISFKDEENLDVINATIPTSTFEYWLGDGTLTKTLTFINNSENFNYEFCATPNKTFNFNSLIQYKQGSEYPQRISSQDGGTLTNTTTDLVLYLLSVSDGLFVTFQVYGGQSNAIEGASVTGTRVLGGSTTTVAQETTDAAGIVTFWLNPDFLHTLTFIKTGLETTILSIFPTQTLYTVTMGSSATSGVTNTAEGVLIKTLPQGSFLDTNTFYTFTYIINSSILSLDEYGFELFYPNGTSIFSNTDTTSTGGTLDKSFNTTNQSRIIMDYYYITNGTRINGTTYWLIYDEGDFSINHFFTRIETYISANIFGISGDDNGYFAKAMLSLLILILVTGTISVRYGLGSESSVTGLIFGVIFMLNMFNFIPNPDFLTVINLGDFLVFIIAIFAISIILKEERR